MEHTKRIILLYHFFHPDDVISARLFSDIAEESAKRGQQVLAMPSVRSCHDGAAAYAKREDWNGVEIHRVWRPDWRQGSNKGRVGNTIAMLLGWTWRALWTRRSPRETVVIGTDPPLGVLVAIPWRLFRPRARIVHWCHDLYPHAAIAEGIVRPDSVFVRLLNALLRVAYRRCDAIVDLGACMRTELRVARGEKRDEEKEPESALHLTVTPWALVEPESVLEADARVRGELFGEAKLGLLYSGNLGRAHIYKPFLELARRVSGDSIAFCYAGRGPRMDELRSELHEPSPSPPTPLPGVPGRGETQYSRGASSQGAGVTGLGEEHYSSAPQAASSSLKVRFAGFATEEELGKRLGAADVHMVSLAPNWTGAVVPSKFFGALAVGRPVLFAGSPESAIARWIEEFKVGWVLDDDASVERVAGELRAFAADPSRVQAMRQHCHDVYRREFSKAVQLEKWGRIL
ncbi:MAG: glycosyltransferase family 4 protein [Pirellulaceae bacterium]|nr:glycosyltransferase family 4 protein [Pirellulaceae bacterium]